MILNCSHLSSLGYMDALLNVHLSNVKYNLKSWLFSDVAGFPTPHSIKSDIQQHAKKTFIKSFNKTDVVSP